jgi:hypothetical protein
MFVSFLFFWEDRRKKWKNKEKEEKGVATFVDSQLKIGDLFLCACKLT